MAYRLPREPSTPRVSLWRKLNRLGVVWLLDNLVALPLDSRNKEQLEWLADEVAEVGGEASMWVARAGTTAQERALIHRMQQAVADEYTQVAEEAEALRLESDPAGMRRVLLRLRRQLHRIRQRDYFPPPEREQAMMAVERLASRVEVKT